MLFGQWRGMPLTLALATTLVLGLASLARADGDLFHHTIPREVDAYNFTTGGPFMAPPVPSGHYAKDYVADAHKCLTCNLHGLLGCCGLGHGLLHHGDGDGGCGHNGGSGHGGDDGNGLDCGTGHGLFGHHGGSHFGSGCLGNLHGGSADCVSAGTAGFATTWAEPSGQVIGQPSGQSICGQPDCTVATKHSHLGHLVGNDPCGGDPGCGLGLGHGRGHGTGCDLCGGQGCASCLGGHGSGLGHGGMHGMHGMHGWLAGAFHHPKVSWFVGAGGPVPLTPGYVPYIVATRSPRDFFAFPPRNPNDP